MKKPPLAIVLVTCIGLMGLAISSIFERRETLYINDSLDLYDTMRYTL